MRLHLKTTANTEDVSFEYQRKLVGVLHKWLGDSNKEHGIISLYSFSWLQNGEKKKNGLNFQYGARWFISFYDEINIKLIMKSILDNPIMFDGMVVTDITIENTPDLTNRKLFYLASPILIKRPIDNKEKHYSYSDSEANKLMKDTLLHKMMEVGLEEDKSFNIKFDLTYAKKKQKLVTYRGVGNMANFCPIIMEGKPETKAFAWNVGIGNSTGVGFGAIY